MSEPFKSSCRFLLSKSANKIWIHQRPYLQTFLEEMASKFTLILFTAGHNLYADAVLTVIDPKQRYFKLRLSRHHCCSLDKSVIIKDLDVVSLAFGGPRLAEDPLC